ncbi:unnamed protein product [Polarella glacialis]|uniref:Uncharacterized protein n=1 Tax=Polarella glacialis TaxID=89957 RepID=A0A813I3F4_POLGL|nr:unnamed protein product [Polarella glacialis]
MEDLTAEQRGSLTMFQEVTANARDEPISVQLLKSCNWSVDQALQLHWATDTMDMAPAPSASAPSRPSQGPSGGPGGLGEPLLMPQGGGGGQAVQATAEAVPSLFGWITQRVKSIGASVFGLLFNFIFGTGSTFGSGLTSGKLLRQLAAT